MRIIGMSYSTKDGEKKYTLEVSDTFDPYFKDTGAGRNAIGEKVETIYVGSLDCSHLKVGMDIELIYGRMCTLLMEKHSSPLKELMSLLSNITTGGNQIEHSNQTPEKFIYSQ